MCDQQSLRSACAYAQTDQNLCWSLEYYMIVKLLTEHHLEFLSLKGACRGSSESTHVKMPHCWKSHALAQLFLLQAFETVRYCTWSLLLTIVLQLINIVQALHHHSFYFILQIFTFSIHIMFSLIPSDANDPQRLMRR